MLKRWRGVGAWLATVLLAGCNGLSVNFIQTPGWYELRLGPVDDITVQAVAREGRAVYRIGIPERRNLRLNQPVRVPHGEAHMVEEEGGSVLELTLPSLYKTDAKVERGMGTVRLLFAPPKRVEDVGPGGFARTVQAWAGPEGVHSIYAVKVPRRQLDLMKVVLAGDKLGARGTVKELAPGCLVAINGGFFDPGNGMPLGALRLGEEWVSAPRLGRTCLIVGKTGPRILNVQWQAAVKAGGATLPVDAFNGNPPQGGSCVVTTRRWSPDKPFAGFSTTAAGGGLTVHHRAPLKGEPSVTLTVQPEVEGSVLGAGPRLVEAAEVHLTADEEQFKPGVTRGLAARSGVGINPDDALWLAFAEACPPFSCGVTLADFAQFFQALGCVSAMNLDGGLSAQLVVAGELVGRPAPGGPAKVANALVVSAR